ncbi:MAG: ABC transporter ATP-binding protein [Anaerolineae bacterium]|jgi:ABC-type branched-subunit amino acid transport system ATPase component|nr:ABC transporter ATP-binding protein [Anaerolineae bacterium]
MSLLEVQEVVAGYGGGPDILKGVNLKVQPGQVQCIIGPNGAGKSTLLKAISGLLTPRQGKITFKGEEIQRLRPDQVLQEGICYVPQERALFARMTVRENLRMGGYILRDKELLEHRIEEVFEMFPILKERRSQKAGTLSGGQQQMLTMGRTLVLKPDIIMLDEPSLGLAPKIVVQIFDIVRLFIESGMTVILVEQNARKGLEYADWGCVLDLGQTMFDGPAESILNDPRIQELYLGKRQSAAAQEARV